MHPGEFGSLSYECFNCFSPGSPVLTCPLLLLVLETPKKWQLSLKATQCVSPERECVCVRVSSNNLCVFVEWFDLHILSN